MKYKMMDWDTNFFGIKVAQISRPRLSTNELSDIISELKRLHVRLVYWASEEEYDEAVAKKLGGCLVDRKTTFSIDFSSVNLKEIASTDIVEPFIYSMPVADLEALAIESGKYSRFAVDPKLPRERFIALYKVWVNKSLSKEISDEVLVIRDGDHVVGMATLGEKDGRGNIGLIAVDSNSRGRKYGEKLVRAAQRWFISKGYEYGHVVTQGQNIPACKLYIKCGYSVEQIKFFYHFWL